MTRRNKIERSLTNLIRSGIVLTGRCETIVTSVIDDKTESGRSFNRTIIAPTEGLFVTRKDSELETYHSRLFQQTDDLFVYSFNPCYFGVNFVALSDGSLYEIYRRYKDVPRVRKNILRKGESFDIKYLEKYSIKKPEDINEISVWTYFGNTLIRTFLPQKK